MLKNSTKIVLTYVITLVVAFALIGGGVLFLIYNFTKQEKQNSNDDRIAVNQPEVSDEVQFADKNQTLLFMLDAYKRQTGSCFVVIRFLPSEGKLLVVPVQSDLLCELDGTQDSLYEFFRTGGSKNAIKCIENAMGIKIDRYMKFDEKSFLNFADLTSSFYYNVPYNLVYDNPDGNDTIIKEGKTYLESETLLKLITFPLYRDKEKERNVALGTIVTKMLDESNGAGIEATLDEDFNTVINSSVETDITIYDFKDQRDAIKYVINPDKKQIAELILPSGNYDDTGLFSFDEGFKNNIPKWFLLDK